MFDNVPYGHLLFQKIEKGLVGDLGGGGEEGGEIEKEGEGEEGGRREGKVRKGRNESGKVILFLVFSTI